MIRIKDIPVRNEMTAKSGRRQAMTLQLGLTASPSSPRVGKKPRSFPCDLPLGLCRKGKDMKNQRRCAVQGNA